MTRDGEGTNNQVLWRKKSFNPLIELSVSMRPLFSLSRTVVFTIVCVFGIIFMVCELAQILGLTQLL